MKTQQTKHITVGNSFLSQGPSPKEQREAMERRLTEPTATPAQASGSCRTSHSPLPWTSTWHESDLEHRINGPKKEDGFAEIIAQVIRTANADLIVRACNNVERLTNELERCRDLLIAYKVAFPNHFSDLDARFGADSVIKSAYQALQDAGVPNAQKGGQQ